MTCAIVFLFFFYALFSAVKDNIFSKCFEVQYCVMYIGLRAEL